MMAATSASGNDKPARRLSEATYAALREAIASAWMRRASSALDREDALTEAVKMAVAESRERQLRPEELLVELKHLEAEISSVFPAVSMEERRTLREWLVQRSVSAYFQDG